MWNIEQIRSGKPNKWNYIDGCMINSVLSLYEITGNKRYLDFADSFCDFSTHKRACKHQCTYTRKP